MRDLIRKILEVDPEKRYTIPDIRQHQWYTSISETEVPKDIVVSPYEQEAARNEAFQGIEQAGLDKQAVLDGLASKACNSLTATFYLLEQRAKKRRSKMKSSNNAIPQTLSNGSTVGVSSGGTMIESNDAVNRQPTTSEPSSTSNQKALPNLVGVSPGPIVTANNRFVIII